MAYVGKTPANAVLTSSDITDGVITSAKIATDAVIAAKIAANAVEEAKVNADAITSAKIAAGAIVDSDINASAAIGNTKLANSSITINSSPISLGGSVTVGEVYPTISSISPSVIDNTVSTIVITGTGFGATGTPFVDLISSAGAITPATSVTRNSTTQITITATLSVDTTYYIRVELGTGLAVRTSTALLTVSDNPVWVTASGSLGTLSGSVAISTINLVCTDATSFAVTTGSVTAGLTFTTGVGTATITGTQTPHTTAATDSFSVTATDAEGQTAVRAFTISWSFGATGGGQFN
jgi:hypothetical protein